MRLDAKLTRLWMAGRRRAALNPRPIDADNHSYEPLDAFTRHLPREFRTRGVRPVQTGKRVELLIGDRVNRFTPNPTFDPIIVPGCLDAFFRGRTPEGEDRSKLVKVEPLRIEYRDRDARLAVTEEQGLDAVLLFPTLGCGVEQALRNDVPATMASLATFNRWLEDDWGFCYRGRLIGVPMLSLADPEAALAELGWLLDRGARMVHRHPKPKVASIENGSDWLHLLVKRLRKLANQTPSAFHEDPLDTVRRHIWVTRPARAGRSDRCGAHPVRLGLAPRLGNRPAAGLRQGALDVPRGRGASDPARQRRRAARLGTALIGSAS
jgi:hypothetical protein